MRIRIPAELAGMLMVAFIGLIFAGIISGILDVVKNRVLLNNKTGRKVISILTAVVWIVMVIVIVLDLTGIAPIIRNILFSL